MGALVSVCVACCLLQYPQAKAEFDSFSTSVEWVLNSTSPERVLSVDWKNQFIWSSSARSEVELRVNITLLEIAQGGHRSVQSSLLSRLCPSRRCPQCNGSGVSSLSSVIGSSGFAETVTCPCPLCAGYGRLPSTFDCMMYSRNDSSGWEWEPGEHVSLSLPPNLMPGQVLPYQPFASSSMRYVQPQLDNSTAEFVHESREDYGRFRMEIEAVVPPQLWGERDPRRGMIDFVEQAASFAVKSDRVLQLTIPITAEEAVFGFQRSMNLFRVENDVDSQQCENLQLHRMNKPTLLDSSIVFPLESLFRKLCPSYPMRNSTNDAEVSSVQVSVDDSRYPVPVFPFLSVDFRIQFLVLNASLYQEHFLQYWNCSIIEVVELIADEEDDGTPVVPTPPVEVNSQEDLEAFLRRQSSKTAIHKEISCPDNSFEEERMAMFEALSSGQAVDQRYHNWLEFLRRS